MQHCLSIHTKAAWLNVIYNDEAIYHAAFNDAPLYQQQLHDAFAKRIHQEINTYLQNPRHVFRLPLATQGTSFQQKVCQALLAIPSGETLTYADLARELQSSPRAIGQACKRNPIALFIPCHRVVAKSGIGGFMGNVANALTIKSFLLAHEGFALC